MIGITIYNFITEYQHAILAYWCEKISDAGFVFIGHYIGLLQLIRSGNSSQTIVA
jgi:hypothetical protein